MAAPTIEMIEPAVSPLQGTSLLITGRNLNAKTKVIIEGIPCESTLIGTDRLYLQAPCMESSLIATVKLINPDGLNCEQQALIYTNDIDVDMTLSTSPKKSRHSTVQFPELPSTSTATTTSVSSGSSGNIQQEEKIEPLEALKVPQYFNNIDDWIEQPTVAPVQQQQYSPVNPVRKQQQQQQRSRGKYQMPEIKTMNPMMSTLSGAIVTITGRFSKEIQVKIDRNDCFITSFRKSSDSNDDEMIVSFPALPEGPKRVRLIEPDGQEASLDGFLYVHL
jgi:hypothetical protein